MSIEVTININAPGLEGAIHTLAQVLANYEMPTKETIEAKTQDTPVIEGKEVEQQQQPAPAAVPTSQPQQGQAQPQPNPAAQQQQSVPTSAPTYDMNQLAVAATQLMDAGRQQDLMNLLATFNVQALTMLPKEQYGAFATKLRELGAKI